MKYMEILPLKMFNMKAQTGNAFVLYKIYHRRDDFIMLKFLAKVAEKYAKSTNTTCAVFWAFHQPKMPAS